MSETQQHHHLLAALFTHPEFTHGIEDGQQAHQETARPSTPFTDAQIYLEIGEALSSSSETQIEGISTVIPALYTLGFLFGEVAASYASPVSVSSVPLEG